MKKTLLFATLATLLFTSCFQPAFYNISKEVPPEQATVMGIINSIVRYTVGNEEYLVVSANEGLRYKKADAGPHNWNVYNALPFSLHSFNFDSSSHTGESIVKVLADSNTLYIVSTTYTTNDDLAKSIPDVVSVYAKQILPSEKDGVWSSEGDWKKIISGSKYFNFSIFEDYVYSDFNTFCTNSVQNENRKAYIRSGSTNAHYAGHRDVKYYELSYTGVTDITNSTSAFETKNNSSNINSAVVLNGNTLFFNSIASTTNETSETDAKYAYFGNGVELKYTDGTETKVAISNCETPISCLAACSNVLLIGRGDYSETIVYTTGGITQTSLTDGIPGTKLQSSAIGNAETQLSPSYLILTLLNVDPSKTELNSTLYASLGFAGSGSSTTASVNYNRIGLWSYYPSRGNWNCE